MSKYYTYNNITVRTFFQHHKYKVGENGMLHDDLTYICFDTEKKIYLAEDYINIIEGQGYKFLELWGDLKKVVIAAKRDETIDKILNG